MGYRITEPRGLGKSACCGSLGAGTQNKVIYLIRVGIDTSRSSTAIVKVICLAISDVKDRASSDKRWGIRHATLVEHVGPGMDGVPYYFALLLLKSPLASLFVTPSPTLSNAAHPLQDQQGEQSGRRMEYAMAMLSESALTVPRHRAIAMVL